MILNIAYFRISDASFQNGRRDLVAHGEVGLRDGNRTLWNSPSPRGMFTIGHVTGN